MIRRCVWPRRRQFAVQQYGTYRWCLARFTKRPINIKKTVLKSPLRPHEYHQRRWYWLFILSCPYTQHFFFRIRAAGNKGLETCSRPAIRNDSKQRTTCCFSDFLGICRSCFRSYMLEKTFAMCALVPSDRSLSKIPAIARLAFSTTCNTVQGIQPLSE